eukprot:jgi/Astpho2/6038/Aster-03993
MQVPNSDENKVLTIRQAKFEAEGFASTGIVLANLGALVTLTDLAGNLPLLQENVFSNDVMYIVEAIPALVRTLRTVSDAQTTRIFLAHGRNRQAEAAFLEQCQPHFTVRTLDSSELHPNFHSIDIDAMSSVTSERMALSPASSLGSITSSGEASPMDIPYPRPAMPSLGRQSLEEPALRTISEEPQLTGVSPDFRQDKDSPVLKRECFVTELQYQPPKLARQSLRQSSRLATVFSGVIDD